MAILSSRGNAGDRLPVPGLRLRVALVVALAFALRVWFIWGGRVLDPMIGDARQYCDYAWNLAQSHIFSLAPPGSASVPPDSYRDPGYPLFLASLLVFLGSGDTWYHAVLMAQAALGAASAGLAMLVASRWLGARASLLVGFAVAVWPHSVAISGFLLSETLFGSMALLAIWLLVRAPESAAPVRWAAAGLCFGAAALVNATLTPFCPLLAACLMARRAAPKPMLAALLLGSLVFPGVWSIRTLSLPVEASAGNRAMTNLVQGSWSDYQLAYVESFLGNAQAKQIMSAIDADVELAVKSPHAWLSELMQRVERDPRHYIAWYAWKPELLWAWSIRVGVGGVYPYPIEHPIYSRYAALSLFESLCVGINPLLFVLMAAASIATLTRPRTREVSIGLYAAALLLAYETLLYSVFQSEPRYSIPFRPLEMLLAATAAQWLWRLWQARHARSIGAAGVPGAPGD